MTHADEPNRKKHPGTVRKRPFRDDVRLSVIGLGGLSVAKIPQKRANRVVAESVESGVNYFDVAPTYANAEQRLGPALEPYRDKVFLACKTHQRGAKEAREELEASLKNLRTDHFDLYQFHAVSSMEDVEKILAPGGAAETFLKARKEGKIRYLGFSAHDEEAAIALIDRFECDSVLFPVNYVCYEQGNFGPALLEHAKENDVARLALKSMAHTPWPEGAERTHPKCWYRPVSDREKARTALRFTLTEDVTAALPPAETDLYLLALDIARQGLPALSGEERESLLATTKGLDPIFRSA